MKVSDEEGVRWLRRIISEIETIRVGSTRRQLLEMFEQHGGLAPIPNPHFVHRRYPIKLDVELSPATRGKKGIAPDVESEDDVIVSISRPYLATKNMD